MTEVSYQVAKRAAKKGAKYYHITRQWQERGNNVTISADLYKLTERLTRGGAMPPFFVTFF
mgnify:CR=1 FL=1